MLATVWRRFEEHPRGRERFMSYGRCRTCGQTASGVVSSCCGSAVDYNSGPPSAMDRFFDRLSTVTTIIGITTLIVLYLLCRFGGY